ncbi:MAG TPA: hypothetical protein VNF06_02735, partial [Candidatus Aquilonibacter sp.]|nr:hypothetical protein [Candidatus Aquilonibacter sp.]
EIKLDNFKVLEYESTGWKALRVAGNMASAQHDFNQRHVLYGDAPKGPYHRELQPEIRASELFVTNGRIFATVDGSAVVWEGFFDKELVKEIIRDRGKKNREILEQVVPKPDKGDKYGRKLMGEIWSKSRSNAVELGYLTHVNLVIGSETARSGLMGKKVMPTFAKVHSEVHIKNDIEGVELKQKLNIMRDRTVTVTSALDQNAAIQKYEISGMKSEGEEKMIGFTEKIAAKMEELRKYALGEIEKNRAPLSQQLLQDWGT